eukprot:GILJ01004256.1.p1 GENE.GILJ01004256.1~~GILJ01004256.1.p1  ORF type:complete len:378 (-),score=69.23 GILJ01004256.1:185-1318(-)
MFLNSANVVDYGGRSYSRYRGDFHLPVEEEDANLTLVHSLGHVFPAHKPQAAKRFFNRSRQQHKLDRIMHNGDTNIKKTQQVLSAVQNNNTHTRSASPQSIRSPSSRNGFRAPKPKHSNANLNVSLIPATWDNIFAANKLLRRANRNGVSIAPQKLVQQKLVPLQTAANFKNIDIATADQDGSHAHPQSVFGLVPDSPARLKKNREASQKTFYQSASQLVNLHIDDLISEPGIQRQPRRQQQQQQQQEQQQEQHEQQEDQTGGQEQVEVPPAEVSSSTSSSRRVDLLGGWTRVERVKEPPKPLIPEPVEVRLSASAKVRQENEVIFAQAQKEMEVVEKPVYHEVSVGSSEGAVFKKRKVTKPVIRSHTEDDTQDASS